MRMDRYEDDKTLETKQTRTNKNQELYTDVYLNNVYVDINNLKEVMENETINPSSEPLKVVKETKTLVTTYEDKNYDIRQLINEAIIKKGDDKIKRSLDSKVDDLEITSLIESINENKEESNSKEKNNDNLLTDLLPSSENTVVVPALEKPLTSEEIAIKEQELIKEEQEFNSLNELEISDADLDDSFVSKNKNLKIVFIILGIIIFLGLLVLFYYLKIKK